MGEMLDRAKGRIKRAAGALTGNKRLERRGWVDETKGKVKRAATDVRRAVERARAAARAEHDAR